MPQDRFDLGWEKFDVYLGCIFLGAPLLMLKELNDLGHEPTDIAPQIFWAIVEVIRRKETCFELGLTNSCLLEFGEESNNRSTSNRPLADRKIRSASED